MTAAGPLLRALLAQAEAQPGQGTRAVALEGGLRVAAKVQAGRAALCVYRDAAAPTQQDALKCAEELNWPAPLVTPGQTVQGSPCLFVAQPAGPPDLFCPGVPCAHLPKTLEEGHLYGLLAGDDWVTVLDDGRRMHWRSMRSGEIGSGTRVALKTFLLQRGQMGRAA